MSSVDLRCPVCSKVLETTEYEHAEMQLEKSATKKYKDRLTNERQEHTEALAKIKQEQKSRLLALTKKEQTEKKTLRVKMDEQARKNKKQYEDDLAQLRKNYQMQFEQMREFYNSQNSSLQNELKASFANQLEAIKKNYEALSSDNRRQLELLQKYLEDEVVGELRDKVSNLEKDKLAKELHLAELVQQLDERNADVVSLKDRLRNADVPAAVGEIEQSENMVEEQTNDQQDEMLKIIKEVAQQKEAGDLEELEDEEEETDESKHGFWGSKQGKRFGLF